MKFLKDSKLARLEPEMLQELQSKFKVNWPEHIMVYNTLSNAAKRAKKSSDEANSIKVFTLADGSWRENGTFIASLYDKLGAMIIMGTLDTSLQSLKSAIEQIDFTEKVHFMCTREIYHSTLHEVITEKNLKILWDDATNMEFREKEDVMKMSLDIPDHYEVKPLTSEHAGKINSIWPHRSEGSVKFIDEVIRTNPSAGIFHKNGELAAWCLQHDNGSLLALQTDEGHLRQGLGSLAVKVICKKIAEINDTDIQTNVIVKNEKSLNLFTKLGFRIIDKNFWTAVINQ